MTFETLVKVLFILFSIGIAILDFKTGSVPRLAFIFAFLAFLTLRVVSNSFSWLAIAGAVMGLSIFMLAFVLSKKKLGLADVWYSGIIGFVLGSLYWYMAISFACVMGILFILVKKKYSGFWSAIPFIPFMAAGSITVSIIEGRIQ